MADLKTEQQITEELKKQRALANAIKRARHLSLISPVAKEEPNTKTK